MSRANTALELAVAELEKNSKFRLGGALSATTAFTALELAVAELEKNSKFRLGGVLSEPTAVSAWNGILNHPMALCRTNRLDVGSPVSGTLVWVVSVGDEDG